MTAIKNILIVLALAVLVALTATNAQAQAKIPNLTTTKFFSSLGYTSFGAPLSLASATTLTIPAGTLFKITGTAKCTRIMPSGINGRLVFLYHNSTDTLVDGVNLKLAGNFNGTADDIIALVAVDTFWVELFRSAN